MQLNEVMKALNLEQVTSCADLSKEVTGGYVSDLLSNVMGQAQPGMIWITMQGHKNIAAVGSLIGMAAVIVAGDSKVEEEAVKKGSENSLPIFKTALSSYEVAGKLFALGVTNK